MENQNQGNQAAPTHDGLSGNAQVKTGGKTRHPNRQVLGAGIQPGIVCEIVDLGTQTRQYQNKAPQTKREIRIAFEHPQLKQKYFVEDDNVRPAMTSKEVTYLVSDRSFLMKFLVAMEGRPLSKEEAKACAANLQKYLGRIIGVQIGHKQNKEGFWYEKIEGIVTWNEQTMILPQPWQPERQHHWWFIDQDQNGQVIGRNFASKVYADLPYYVRQTIRESAEAKIYAQNGGVFAENPENQQQGGQGGYQQPQQVQPQQQQMQMAQQPQQMQTPGPAPTGQQPAIHPNAPVSADGSQVLVLTTTQYTMDQFLQDSRWTPEKMVADGYATWAPNPNYQPAQQQATGPAPSGPAPSGPAPGGPAPVQQGQPPVQQQAPVQASQQMGQQPGYQDDDDMPF